MILPQKKDEQQKILWYTLGFEVCNQEKIKPKNYGRDVYKCVFYTLKHIELL